MKKIILALLVLLLVSPVFAANPKNSLSDLNVYDINGKVVTSKIFEDKEVTMVNIFTTWCTWCIREMGDIKKLYENLPEGSNIVMICADAYEAPSELIAIVDAFKLNCTILKMRSDDLLSYYNLTGYPTTLFVDSEGEIIKEHVGANNYKGYRAILESLLKR